MDMDPSDPMTGNCMHISHIVHGYLIITHSLCIHVIPYTDIRNIVSAFIRIPVAFLWDKRNLEC
eukprot:4469963-Pleurochrysis_carterae.AAC.1